MAITANGSVRAGNGKKADGGVSVGAAASSKSASLPAASSGVERTDAIVKQSGGRPDLASHHAQLDLIKGDIDRATAELDDVKARLGGAAPANTPEGKRRAELHAELDTIRQSQAGNKGSRGKVLDELKAKQDAMSAKIKALQASRSKSTYKSPEDVDSAIARLNAQVESGSLKLVEERRVLSEISNLRKSRKAVETFAQQQKAIDAEREQVEALRAQLDDPQSRALSKRFDEIRTELDALKAKAEKSGESRQQLLGKRAELQTQLDDLWKKRRARQADFRSENDAHQAKVRQEREKRNEAFREEKRAEDIRRRKEEEKALREEASQPAYAKDIEDCDVLVRYFSGKSGSADHESAPSTAEDDAKKNLEGVKPLELRKIANDDAFAGATIAKKKGADDDEDGYFVGGGVKKGKGKNKNRSRGTPLSLADDGASAEGTGKEAPLNVPLPTLSALLSLNIPPPTNVSDVARVVENLKRKRAFFVADQKRKTQENVDALEKKIAAASLKDEKASGKAAKAEGKTSPAPASAAEAKADTADAEDTAASA